MLSKSIATTIILFNILLMTPNASIANENSDYLNGVVGTCREECEGERGADLLNCWADYSPEKCKGLIYDVNKTAWKRCVYSCGTANIYSKTFGDCSD